MSERKDTNPKDAVGTGKVPMSTVPGYLLLELGLGMLEGARKYGRHNYRAAGVRASVYYDAAFRHLIAWWEGQDIDPDSGRSHVVKAMATLAVLYDSMTQGNWVDDRPPATVNQNMMEELNKAVKDIIAKYTDAVEPWTQERMEREHPTHNPCAVYETPDPVPVKVAPATGYCTGTDRRVGEKNRRVKQFQEQGRQFYRRSPVTHRMGDGAPDSHNMRRWGRRVTDPLAG